MRLLRDFALIPLPFAVLSVFFFLGEVSTMGVLCAVFALAALWYVRPRAGGPDGIADDIPEDPPVDRHPGAGSMSAGM